MVQYTSRYLYAVAMVGRYLPAVYHVFCTPLLEIIGVDQVLIEQAIHKRALQKRYGKGISIQAAYDRKYKNAVLSSPPEDWDA